MTTLISALKTISTSPCKAHFQANVHKSWRSQWTTVIRAIWMQAIQVSKRNAKLKLKRWLLCQKFKFSSRFSLSTFKQVSTRRVQSQAKLIVIYSSRYIRILFRTCISRSVRISSAYTTLGSLSLRSQKSSTFMIRDLCILNLGWSILKPSCPFFLCNSQWTKITSPMRERS